MRKSAYIFLIVLVILSISFNFFIPSSTYAANIKEIKFVPAVNFVTHVGDPIGLPDKVLVIYSDYTTDQLLANWNTLDQNIFNNPGKYTINGTIKATNDAIKATITVFPKDKQIQIIGAGASITYGFGVSNVRLYSYTAQMNQRQGSGYNNLNFGVSSTTVVKKGNFPYTTTAQYKNSLKSNPDAVVIMLGSNDTRGRNWNYADDFINDLKSLINSYRDLSTKPIVYVTIPPDVFRDGVYGMKIDYCQILFKRIMQAVDEMQASDVSIIDLQKPLANSSKLFPDAVHPNNEGTSTMGDIILRNIRGQDVTVRTGQVEPTTFTSTYGMYLKDSTDSRGKKMLTGINNDDWVSFNQVNFDKNNGKILVRLSAILGTKVDIHVDSLNGPIIGSKTIITNAKFNTQSIDVERLSGNHDLYFTFSNAKYKASTYISSISWINFTP